MGIALSWYRKRTWVRISASWAALLVYLVSDRFNWVAVLLILGPVLLASNSKFLLALLWAVGLLVVWGLDPGVLVILVLALSGLLAPYAVSRPRRRLPLPTPRYRDGWRLAWQLRRVDRAFSRGDAHQVRRLLQGAPSWETRRGQSDVRARQALAALDDSRYQEASDAIGRANLPSPRCARVLSWLRAEVLTALGQSNEAVAQLRALVGEWGKLTHEEQVAFSLSNAVALAGAGDYAHSAAAAHSALAVTSLRGWTLERMRAYRLMAEAEYAQGSSPRALTWVVKSIEELETGLWWQYLTEADGRGEDQSRLLWRVNGPLGRQFVEILRLRFIMAELSGDASGESLERMEEAAGFISLHGQPDVLTDLLVRQAQYLMRSWAADGGDDHVEGSGGTDEIAERNKKALSSLLRALRELDRNRYTLRSPRDRAAWSTRLHDALALALSLTLQSGDARLQAELIEFGRVQTLPSPSANDGTQHDQLALAAPPVIRIRESAQVSRYGDAFRPPPVDLETAAAAVAGIGAWWLSYWEAGEFLYWSLVPPTGPVEAGRIDFSPASELQLALRALRAGLPVRLDNESVPKMDWRMAKSPLQSDPAAERRQSALLAGLLLPRKLLATLRTRVTWSGGPLPLAIAPSAGLAFVPWSLLELRELADGMVARLVHAADWVLAPAASLATLRPLQEHGDGQLPIRLAIVDTWQGPGLDALPAARRQASTLPSSVEILGGVHWTERIATLRALRAALTGLDPASTMLFACHALPARSDFTAQGGPVLAEPGPGGGPLLLTPSAILGLFADGITLPIQALLLACDSSNLSSSTAGEWLTTAPAMLAAGSRTIVTTLFPVKDTADEHDPVLNAAVAGEDLRAAIRRLQIAGARVWDAGIPERFQDTPLHWAAYAVVAAHHSTPKAQGRVSEFSPRLRTALHDATKEAVWLNERTVHSGHLMAIYLTNMVSIPQTFFAEESRHFINKALRARSSPAESGRLAASTDLVRALADGQAIALREGRAVEPEDVLRAALAVRSPARKLVWAMALARVHRKEQILRVMESTLAQSFFYEEPRFRLFKDVAEFLAFVSYLEEYMLCRTQAASPPAPLRCPTSSGTSDPATSPAAPLAIMEKAPVSSEFFHPLTGWTGRSLDPGRVGFGEGLRGFRPKWRSATDWN